MRKKKANPWLAVASSTRSAAALLREAAKRVSMEDTAARERLAVQMIWDGPGFDRSG